MCAELRLARRSVERKFREFYRCTPPGKRCFAGMRVGKRARQLLAATNHPVSGGLGALRFQRSGAPLGGLQTGDGTSSQRHNRKRHHREGLAARWIRGLCLGLPSGSGGGGPINDDRADEEQHQAQGKTSPPSAGRTLRWVRGERARRCCRSGWRWFPSTAQTGAEGPGHDTGQRETMVTLAARSGGASLTTRHERKAPPDPRSPQIK